MERKYTCCFTGHRPEKMPEVFGNKFKILELSELFSHIIRKLHAECGVTTFICGMARGGDLLFAEAVDRLSRSCGIELICALPFAAQAHGFPAEERRLHEELCSRNSVITAEELYSGGCYMRRNRFMVDNSSRILALTNGTGGGTAATLRYAEKSGLARAIVDGRLSLTSDIFFFGKVD